MLKKRLSVVLADEQIESIIIDRIINDALEAARDIDIDETIEIYISRIHYGYYVGWLGGEISNAADSFASNLADEAELHGLRFERLSHPNPVEIHAHFKVYGRLS